jgi:hypothetical protein
LSALFIIPPPVGAQVPITTAGIIGGERLTREIRREKVVRLGTVTE